MIAAPQVGNKRTSGCPAIPMSCGQARTHCKVCFRGTTALVAEYHGNCTRARCYEIYCINHDAGVRASYQKSPGLSQAHGDGVETHGAGKMWLRKGRWKERVADAVLIEFYQLHHD